MYVLAVYDIGVKRVEKVRRFLIQYLGWVQNSVFEGEITEGQLAELADGVREIIDKKADSVYIYCVSDKKWLAKDVLGIEKEMTENII
jgi:CRISPR-associated protein Cas2